VGLPAGVVACLAFEAVISVVSGPFVEGSRVVASGTSDRVSVSFRTPGERFLCGRRGMAALAVR
jgi:hypothetical protein